MREFLKSRGIRPAPRFTLGNGAYMLVVGDQAEVLKTARELYPFVFKKRDELQTIVDYMEDRITGSDVPERFKALQDSGIREKNRWPASAEIRIPFTRSDGCRLGRRKGGRGRIRLNAAQIQEIQVAHRLGENVNRLAKKFNISPTAVATALRIDRTTILDE